MSNRSLEALVARVRDIDPDLVLAADEVDADLLDWFSTLPLSERLDRAARMGADLEKLRLGRRTG